MEKLDLGEYYLRKFELSDAERHFILCSSEDVTRYLPIDTYKSIDESVKYIKEMQERYELNNFYSWAVIDKKIDKLIGYIDIDEIDNINKKCEIGFMLLKDFWGKGIMTIVCKTIINFAFTRLNVNKVEAQCENENIASSRVLEKSGMALEGVIKEDRFRKGKFVDRKYYGILKKEFLENQNVYSKTQ